MPDEGAYEKLTEAELRAEVLERPDGLLPPREEAKALLDEWIRRRSSTRSRMFTTTPAGGQGGS
jgi:hypothetical protein